jgi:hypothetical protein
MSDNTTHFSNKCDILADLWMNYRDDEEFTDFIEYNDLGLPLAYMVQNSIVKIESTGESLIEETFDLLLGAVGVDDQGFETLDDLLELEDLG